MATRSSWRHKDDWGGASREIYAGDAASWTAAGSGSGGKEAGCRTRQTDGARSCCLLCTDSFAICLVTLVLLPHRAGAGPRASLNWCDPNEGGNSTTSLSLGLPFDGLAPGRDPCVVGVAQKLPGQWRQGPGWVKLRGQATRRQGWQDREMRGMSKTKERTAGRNVIRRRNRVTGDGRRVTSDGKGTEERGFN